MDLRLTHFKQILNGGYQDNVLKMRNNLKIRKLFGEIISVLCLSKKKHTFDNIKIKTDDIIRIPPNLKIDQPLTKTIGIDLIKKHAGNILFENDNYIVLNKNSGIAVHGGSKNIIGLIDLIREKYGKNIDLCHRIDKNTTGCLVFGKHKKAVKFFNNLLIDNNVKKTYQAVLKGKLKKNIVINKPIYKNITTKSKNSISKFKIIEHLNNATLVEVEIYTGRSHQIRIHSALINHPIIIDNRYGDKNFNNCFYKFL